MSARDTRTRREVASLSSGASSSLAARFYLGPKFQGLSLLVHVPYVAIAQSPRGGNTEVTDVTSSVTSYFFTISPVKRPKELRLEVDTCDNVVKERVISGLANKSKINIILASLANKKWGKI